MGFFTVRTMWERLFPRPRLKCRSRLWTTILHELRERGQGSRESGGFLLGYRHGDSRTIEAMLPYDDVDPNALQGHILFDGSRMDVVWQECRRRGLEVVGDVHTHPAGYGQSSVDRANPMMPEKGHLALIVPNYADRLYLPGKMGIYEFRGRDGWIDHSARGRRFFSIESS